MSTNEDGKDMASQVTDFLRNKWEQSFYFFDVNMDGRITREDFSRIADNVSRATNASQDEADKTSDQWVKWFKLMWPDPSIIVNQERFVDDLEEFFVNDEEKHRRETRATASDMFHRIDLNKNGEISIKEFEIFYKACGITSAAAILHTFKKIDRDDDGIIQRDEFIEGQVRYFTNPDQVAGKAYLFLAPEGEQM